MARRHLPPSALATEHPSLLPLPRPPSLMTREKMRAERERDGASARVVSSCHARARARLWRNDSRYNLHRCTSTARKRELDKFPGPRAIDLQIYTNKGGEGTGRRAVALHVTRRPMIAIVVNLAIYRICQHSKPRPGMKERNGRAGKEGKRQAPFARVRARLRCRRRRGRGDLRRAIAYAHTYAYVGRTGNGVIWPK